MVAKHQVKLTGPGLSFERPVTEDVAHRIISLVMTGTATSVAGGPTSVVNAVDGESSAASRSIGQLTAKQFIAAKKPSNDYERVTCLAYYGSRSQHLTQFKTGDIRNLARDAAVHLSNPTVAVMHATSTYRYLAPASCRMIQFTTL